MGLLRAGFNTKLKEIEEGNVADIDMKFLKSTLPNNMSFEELKFRNRETVERTIREYEEMRKKKGRQYDDDYAERSDAVITYLKHLDQGGRGVSAIDQYFGRKELARLRGDAIREKLMGRLRRITQ